MVIHQALLSNRLRPPNDFSPTLVHFSPLHTTLRHYMHRQYVVQALFELFKALKRLKFQGKSGFLQKEKQAGEETKE